MASKGEEQIIDVVSSRQGGARVYSEQFQYLSRSITHENRLELQKKPQTCAPFQIKNYIAKKNELGLTKVTEIHLDDRIIKIIDTFCPDQFGEGKMMSQSQVKQEKLNEVLPRRQYLLQKRGRRPKNISAEQKANSSRFRAKDTKNVVKNIFRLFKSWAAKNTSDELRIANTLKQLKAQVGKYNNTLVLNISQNPILRGSFLEFCENQGGQCIRSSNIKDKQCHLEALERYRLLCYREGIAPTCEATGGSGGSTQSDSKRS